ncbi:MAG: phospho-N-acetylmuramoyl-pentapeptide-transferase [candidate division WS6 bacterium 34_10]|uniref:Phospho-N-acetylmuramoyl-pentapeptide-transferase n=1 Tax=candidate division WS6 bacterium 34_10 TaxID=1641389 RepID=A0A117LZN2_9BACT|nr:MAG: phospho-N-acetylmuramoyl-pentapeptide-transferase [candidate division WS6 bacterium 34_10]
MLEALKTGLSYFFISTVASVIFAPIMISLLYKFNQVSGIKKTKLAEGKGTNALFLRIMNTQKTNGTPNMGGILIWILVPLITYFLVDLTAELRVLLFGFILFGFWGFVDVAIFTNGFKNNEKLRAFQETFWWRFGKLVVAIILNFFVIQLLYKTGELDSISLLNAYTISVTPFLILILSTLGQFSIYSAELTDGLDGLMAGIFTIINVAFVVLLLIQGHYIYIPFLMIVLGVLIVDLYFNIPPARFWNGGPGAMPLGFAFFFIALLTNNLIPFFFITGITWAIMLSSMIQLVSMKFFNKKVFKIAPLHHHFQAVGWPQYKIVMRFWLFTAFGCIVGIYLGLL